MRQHGTALYLEQSAPELTSEISLKGKEVCIRRISCTPTLTRTVFRKTLPKSLSDLVMLGRDKIRGLIGDESGEEMAGEPYEGQTLDAAEQGIAAHRQGRPKTK